MENPLGLIQWLYSTIGGAATAFLVAILGRLMYHTQEVRKKNRKFISWELVWELPCALGMAIIGDGLATYLQLDDAMRTSLIAMLSFLGPRWIEVIIYRLFKNVVGDDKP